ncbi:hypothetical protein D3C76_1084990 [compost metagenome]
MIIAVAMTAMMIEGMTIDMIVVTMIATTVVIAIATTGTTDTSGAFEKGVEVGQLPDLLPL